ncbi:MAG: plastocyanin/azurin family copper-binding protein [Candidatus Methylomirabilales bacterium]
MSTAHILVLACAAALVLAGCGGAASGSRAGWEGTGGKSTAVTVQTFQFRPVPLEVKAGTRVTWTNNDDIEHTVTSGTPERRDGRFNSPLEGKGATSSFSFTEAGSYPYFCDRHDHMRGEIRVN